MRNPHNIFYGADRKIQPFKIEHGMRGLQRGETFANTCAKCRRVPQKELTLYNVKIYMRRIPRTKRFGQWERCGGKQKRSTIPKRVKSGDAENNAGAS